LGLGSKGGRSSVSSVFIIPNTYVKNAEDRLVVLNRVALSVIEEVRGEHPDLVFTYRGSPVTKILNSAWKCARERAADKLEADTKERHLGASGMCGFTISSTRLAEGCARRGVSFEDRQDLLVTEAGASPRNYSQAELENLIAAAEKVCASQSAKVPHW